MKSYFAFLALLALCCMSGAYATGGESSAEESTDFEKIDLELGSIFDLIKELDLLITTCFEVQLEAQVDLLVQIFAKIQLIVAKQFEVTVKLVTKLNVKLTVEFFNKFLVRVKKLNQVVVEIKALVLKVVVQVKGNNKFFKGKLNKELNAVLRIIRQLEKQLKVLDKKVEFINLNVFLAVDLKVLVEIKTQLIVIVSECVKVVATLVVDVDGCLILVAH